MSLYKVTSIIDGDTIKINVTGKIESIRLLGIDSPETGKLAQCFANEARLKMSQLTGGKIVRLEKDSIQPDRDMYNRLLRYVYLEDGTLVNAEMVKGGFAKAYTKYKSDKLPDFKILERTAKNEKAGLWGSCTWLSRIFIGDN